MNMMINRTLQSIATVTCCTLVWLATAMPASNAHAQERQLFGGAGIPDSYFPEPEPPRFTLPRLFSRGDNAGKPAAPATPAVNWPQLGMFRNNGAADDGQPGLLGKLPPLFPPADPNRPKLLDEFNQKTKQFFNRASDNVTNWARDKSDGMRERSAQAWNSLTRGLRPEQPQAMPQAQPRMRSAELMNGQDRVRF